MSTKSALMVASLILSVVIGLVLARKAQPVGPAARSSAAYAPLIGLSLDTLKEARWQADRDLFVKESKALGAADVLVQSANGDDAVQINNVESLISRHVDVLVIVPHNGMAMAKAVQLAHQANIPVIAYDRLIDDCDLDLYLSFDNVRVGRLQAEYLLAHLPTPGHGKIIRICGAKTDHNAVLFKQGQDEALKPYVDRGDVQVIWDDWADNWTPESAMKIVRAAVTAKGADFQGILASNDSTAAGAIQALSEEKGLAGKVLVTGQDAELVACQRIIEGTQTMTIYKPLSRLARRAAQVAVDMAHGRPVIARDAVNNGKLDVPAILEDVIAVDKSNMMQTVIADGFHTKDEIYGK